MQKLTFKANRLSGVYGSCFALSTVLDVVKPTEKRRKFNFPFYALSIDLKADKSDEWINTKGYNEVCNDIISFIKKNGLDYFEETARTMTKEASHFEGKAKIIIKEISKKSNQDLIKSYNDFKKEYVYYFHLGAMSFIYESLLSERLSNSLAKRYSNTAEILEPLLKTNYKSFMMESEELLLKIKNSPDNKQLINQYKEDFFFMKANYEEAPIITKETIKEDLKTVTNRKEKQTAKDKIKDLTEEEQIIINLMKSTEIIRDQRKKTNQIGNYLVFRFIDEIEKRTNLPRKLIKRAFGHEFPDLINHPDNIKPILEKREFASLVWDGKNSHYLDYNALEEEATIDKSQKELKGTAASKGRTKGIARIVRGPRDFPKLNKGEILVTEMTRPEFLPIMKKSAAIVTDEGGLTCHAAIVARELGIPCIIGTKIATLLIKDGNEIEVDANKGIVKVLNKTK